MSVRRLLGQRHRRVAAVAAGAALAATVSACSSFAQGGAPVGERPAGPTVQPASATAPGRSFDFEGMEFALTGKTDYRTNLPQCPKPQPVVRIPAGVVADVDVVPRATANCPAQPWVRPIAPQYPAGYLGEVALLSGYDEASFYVRIAKPHARPLSTLPAGSFGATMPASAASFVFVPGLTSPVVLFWDSVTDAILLVTGPHSTALAREVASSLRTV